MSVIVWALAYLISPFELCAYWDVTTRRRGPPGNSHMFLGMFVCLREFVMLYDNDRSGRNVPPPIKYPTICIISHLLRCSQSHDGCGAKFSSCGRCGFWPISITRICEMRSPGWGSVDQRHVWHVDRYHIHMVLFDSLEIISICIRM